MTAPHEVLARLRKENGLAQMSVFAEALYCDPSGTYARLSLIAAAYMLGRCDGVNPVETPAEPNGSAGSMAEAVLRAGGVLHGVDDLNDLPF